MDTSSPVLESKCEPIHKLAFAKTHKTGGSTLQNILFRLVKYVISTDFNIQGARRYYIKNCSFKGEISSL